MIKANEIRIGNIYNRKHGKGWTETVIDEMIMAEIFGQSMEYALDDFEPIQFTEDYFKQFGFVLEYELPNGKNAVFADFEHRTKDYRIYLSDFKKHNSIHFDAGNNWFPELVEFQYVHELQNIYHSLTGKELSIIKS